MDPKNPAQQQRSSLMEALDSQQRQINAQRHQIKVLTRAVASMAKAAGVESHPHFAALVRVADIDNPAQPIAAPPSEPATETTEQALAPDTTDDPQDVGGTDGANDQVTPDATTDVQSSEVVLDAQPSEQVDVTRPVSGTEEPRPDNETSIETEVRVGTPTTDVAFPESGWKGATQHRLLSSLKLARLRKQAEIEDGDDLAIGQRIHDDESMSDHDIEAEAATLEKVLTSRTASRPASAARNLVPTKAAGVARTMPSLGSAQGEQQQHTAVASSIGDDEVAFV